MTPLDHAFEVQAAACAELGSPFMARLLRCLPALWNAQSALGLRAAQFSGDIGPSGHSLPLRIAGGLHALVLSGRDTGLAAVYPPSTAAQGALEAALARALASHDDFLSTWIARAPQTNEVRRSAVLIAAAHWIAARHPLPFASFELGASGGLNLGWDRYALAPIGTGVHLGPDAPALTLCPEWRGAPPPPARPVTLVHRAGADLTPLDARKSADALRLAAYLWADQPERLALTRAAMKAQTDWPETGDAIDWLARQLGPRPGQLRLIYHTIAWQYFPKDAQRRGTALIEAQGRAADAQSPLAWLAMEADGSGPGAAVTLRLWPGDLSVALARADFHGRWVDWRASQG